MSSPSDTEDSIIIISLLHDLCKATCYHHCEDVLQKDRTVRKMYVKDYSQFPIGHGMAKKASFYCCAGGG